MDDNDDDADSIVGDTSGSDISCKLVLYSICATVFRAGDKCGCWTGCKIDVAFFSNEAESIAVEGKT